MGKPSRELKKRVVQARHKGKSYSWIERNMGVLRGTAYQWVNRYKRGTLHIDRRTKEFNSGEQNDYEFLKKCFALLEEIRSQSHK